ncbi:hypothetical protein [Enterobacter cancerogenus]|uniref:hypothetical protein n=1 Tax=Enterobacter cancerogenus TaxID=69218 RepID=UPI003FA3DCBF
MSQDYDAFAMIQALIAQGFTAEQAGLAVMEDLKRIKGNASVPQQGLRDEHGRLNTDAHKAFFSRERMKQVAQDYYDPLEGIESTDSLSKKEWVSIITGRNKETHTPRPLNNVQDGIAFFQNLRNKNQ